MSYTTQLIKLAKKLDQPLSVEFDENRHLFKVSINMVGYKNGYLRQSIWGMGTLIEDACYDFIRKSRGGQIVHYITEQTADVL